MAVAIALDNPNHSAKPDAHECSPAASANPCLQRGNSPFAALLAKTQTQASRRAGVPRTSPTTSSRSNEPTSGDASPSESARSAGASRAPAAQQRPDAHPGTPAGSAAKTQEGSADSGAGSPPAKNRAGTPADAHAANRGANTAVEKSAGNVTSLPPAALLPAATAPDPTLNAVAEVAAQANASTADPPVSEQPTTVAATEVPTLEASQAPSNEAEFSVDPDVSPTGSSSNSSSKPAILATPVAAGQDANIADGALLLHATPAEAAASSPSQQAVPQSAHTPPDASEWAEARETVAVRVDQAFQDGVQNVSINLHPAELGHVGIELSFHAGGVSVQMTLSRQDTYEAFSRDRAALEQQLAQTGINLGSGGLDLRFDQKRDQPTAFAETSIAARVRPAQRDAVTHSAARPRTANGLLNIIA